MNVKRKMVKVIVTCTVIAMMAALPTQYGAGLAEGYNRSAGGPSVHWSQVLRDSVRKMMDVISVMRNRTEAQEIWTIEDEAIPLAGPEEDAGDDAAETLFEVEAVSEPVIEEAPPTHEHTPAEQHQEEAPADNKNSTEPALVTDPIVTNNDEENGEPTETKQENGGQAETTVSIEETPLVEYTVVFMDTDGVLLQSLIIKEGDHIREPAEPVLEGHTFAYWYDVDNYAAYDFDRAASKNLYLKPMFTPDETEADQIATDAADNTPPAVNDQDEDPVPPLDTVDEEMAQGSDHEVIGMIKGDNGLEISIVKEPVLDDMREETLDATSEDISSEAMDTSSEDTSEELDPTSMDDEEPTDEDTAEPEDADEGADAALIPSVEIQYSFVSEAADGGLVEGSLITVTAVLANFPEDAQLQYQWQNNADGEFTDVPGATSISYTFAADARNTGCAWRLNITMIEPAEDAIE